ncbi:MAG: hypothetical protein ACR2NU_04705 [Aeoliella sp.]
MRDSLMPPAPEDNPYASPSPQEVESTPSQHANSVEPIRLFGDTTVDDFMSAYRLALRKSWTLWLRYIMRAFFVLMTLFFLFEAYRFYLWGDWESARIMSAMSLGVVLCLVWGYFQVRRNVKRHLDAMDEKMGDAPAIVDDAGLHLHGVSMTSDFSWEAFDGYRANGHVLVLYLTYPRLYVGLFEKHAVPPADWQRLLDLVHRKLHPM